MLGNQGKVHEDLEEVQRSGEDLGRFWTEALDKIQSEPCRHKEI
jgi:hypothetical protein